MLCDGTHRLSGSSSSTCALPSIAGLNLEAIKNGNIPSAFDDQPALKEHCDDPHASIPPLHEVRSLCACKLLFGRPNSRARANSYREQTTEH